MISIAALFTNEDGAGVELSGRHDEADGDAVGVAEADSAGGVGERVEFDGSGAVGAECGLDLIEPVSAPVGHLAARVVAPLHPRGVEFGVVGAVRRGVEPQVPVEGIGDGFGGEGGVVARSGVVDAFDEVEFAEAAVADEVGGEAVHGHGALLAADLKDAVVAAGGADDGASFGEVDGEGFLGVDVFAGLAGVYGAQGAGVVGGADDDPVDVFVVEEAAVVGVDAPLLVAFGGSVMGAFEEAVGDGDNFGGFRELIDEEVGAVAGADHADAGAVVGGEDTGGCGCSGRGQIEEFAPVDRHYGRPFLVRFSKR
jgi:hypothetical protein